MAKSSTAPAGADQEIPVDKIETLRFTDNLGHIFKLEERWHQHGVFDLTQVIHTAQAPKEKADEPG